MRAELLKKYRKEEYYLSECLFDKCLKVEELNWVNTKGSKKKGFSLFKKKKRTSYKVGTYVLDFAEKYKEDFLELLKIALELDKTVSTTLMSARTFKTICPEYVESFIGCPNFSSSFNQDDWTMEFEDLSFDALLNVKLEGWRFNYIPLFINYIPDYQSSGSVMLVLMDLQTATIEVRQIATLVLHGGLAYQLEKAS